MKNIVIIKSNDLSKGNHILLSKSEFLKVEVNTLSYNSLNREPIKELYNEYYNENKENTTRYEAEPEIIIEGKIFNYSNLELQKDNEERYLSQELKEYINNKFGDKLDLKDEEKIMAENILHLNRDNIHRIIDWEYDRQFDTKKDYRDIIWEMTPTEGDALIIYLEKMYIYSYREVLNIEKGYGHYTLVLRKNPIIKENMEIK